MMKSSIVTVTLIALCSWLRWTAYEETKQPVPLADTTDSRGWAVGTKTAQGQGKSEPQKTTVIFPPLETFGEIVSRPLFNVSRRPIAVEKIVPDAKPTELNVMLSGIVIGQARQIAHLRSATDKQTLALSVGDKIGDWHILSIFPDHVVLRSGGRVETLFMQKPGAVVAKPTSRRATTRSRRKARRNLRRSMRGGKQ